MTYRPRTTVRVVPSVLAFALAFAALFVPGCGSGCKLGCGNSDADVMLPATEDLETAVATTDAPCQAQLARRQTGLVVNVYSPHAGTCQVHVQLLNGHTYEFAVEFQSREFSCCGTIVYSVDASVPELISTGDGGAGN